MAKRRQRPPWPAKSLEVEGGDNAGSLVAAPACLALADGEGQAPAQDVIFLTRSARDNSLRALDQALLYARGWPGGDRRSPGAGQRRIAAGADLAGARGGVFAIED